MIIAKIEALPLRISFKPGMQAAASAWGDKGPGGRRFIARELIAPLCIGGDATQIGPLMLEVQKKLQVSLRISLRRSSSASKTGSARTATEDGALDRLRR